MQFHFITYGMELYTNHSIPINTNIEQCMCMCMRASGASELRKFWNFYILKLLFLSIFCHYIHWQITWIPWLNFIWGGGGASAPQAPPPHQYASGGGGGGKASQQLGSRGRPYDPRWDPGTVQPTHSSRNRF